MKDYVEKISTNFAKKSQNYAILIKFCELFYVENHVDQQLMRLKIW